MTKDGDIVPYIQVADTHDTLLRFLQIKVGFSLKEYLSFLQTNQELQEYSCC